MEFGVDVGVRVSPLERDTRLVDAALEHEPARGLGQSQQRGDQQHRGHGSQAQHDPPVDRLAESAQRKGAEVAKDDADDGGHLVGDEGRASNAGRHRLGDEDRHRDQRDANGQAQEEPADSQHHGRDGEGAEQAKDDVADRHAHDGGLATDAVDDEASGERSDELSVDRRGDDGLDGRLVALKPEVVLEVQLRAGDIGAVVAIDDAEGGCA